MHSLVKNTMETAINTFIANHKRGCILFETGRKYVHRVTYSAKIQAVHFRATKTLPDTVGDEADGDHDYIICPSHDDKRTIADVAHWASRLPENTRLLLVANYGQANPYIKKALQGFDETMCLCLVWSSNAGPRRPHMSPNYRYICEWADHHVYDYNVAKSQRGEYGRAQKTTE